MIIQPVLTCALGIALAAVFELAYTYIDKRWNTPATKDGWVGTFWLLVILVLVLTKTMPYAPPGMFSWVPFIAVVLIHVAMVIDGSGFSRLPGSPPPGPSGTNQVTPSPDIECQGREAASKNKASTKAQGGQQ